ncbi:MULTISPECIES: hypothetical protein [Microcystis]|uniref:Sigma-70 family RNA polymerase sigma factor n=1 Tax=Microcystis panniformis FACHB-1757 TaxID=1638788 RepID=A0A0K1SAM4_9CHRO|nr:MULTISPECIES: hypothetical protein [Microcystis]AKV71172.1 hypothetical protein VL20_6444 [Microcystis panniformis FACHB-1757]TRT76308.1 MAG: hypothetical protein EWV83_11315 [Microcystis sp. M_OC_Ca_00000000_S217Cul]TRT86017.1 MAG: hypothetical protein EWV66_17045 [Microcystis sp. M_OC_Ca_00000000_C217Col]
MDDLERIVDELALEAKSYPKGSKDRLKYLTKLTNVIQQSQPSCRNYFDLPYPIYRELQDEAIQETWCLLYEQQIDRYDPNEGHILRWFRKTLGFRFCDICAKYLNIRRNKKMKALKICMLAFFKGGENLGLLLLWQIIYANLVLPKTYKIQQQSLDEPVSQNDDPSSKTLLDLIEQPETAHPRHREYEKLRKLIEQDPTGQFREAHIRNNEEANFQAIALGRIDGRSWNDLSEQWNIKVSVLSSFYQRSIQRFKQIFRDYLDI